MNASRFRVVVFVQMEELICVLGIQIEVEVNAYQRFRCVKVVVDGRFFSGWRIEYIIRHPCSSESGSYCHYSFCRREAVPIVAVPNRPPQYLATQNLSLN